MTNIHKIIDNCKQMNISIRRNDFNLKCYGDIILKIQKKKQLINQIWEKKFDNNFKKKDEIDVMVKHMINLDG